MKLSLETLLRAFRSLLAVALSLACGSCANHAGEPAAEGKRISRLTIRHKGSEPVDEARLRSYISSKEGSTYSSQRIDDDIIALYESGLVDDIRFRAEADGDQVEVIAEATLRPPIGPSSGFVGNSIFSDQKLAIATQMKFGEQVTSTTVTRACRNIRELYRKHGHRATVTTRSNVKEGTATDLIFVIQEHLDSKPRRTLSRSAPPPHLADCLSRANVRFHTPKCNRTPTFRNIVVRRQLDLSANINFDRQSPCNSKPRANWLPWSARGASCEA